MAKMAVDIIEKSRIYIREGQFEKAQILIRRALDNDPNLANAVELFGDLAVKMGRKSEAMERYERACDIYTNNNQFIDAVICLEKLLMIDKTKYELLPHVAELYQSAGFSNESVKKLLEYSTWAIENKKDDIFISNLKEIVDRQPKNLSLRLSYAKILLTLDQEKKAEEELNKLQAHAEEIKNEEILNEVNKLRPQYDGGEEELDPKSRIELGKLLYEIGSKDEALVEFDKAVDDLLKANQMDEAIKILNYIIEIDPDNADAKNKIAEIKAELEKSEEKSREMPIEEEKLPSETAVEELLSEEAAEGEMPSEVVEEKGAEEPEIVPETPAEEVMPEITGDEVKEDTTAEDVVGTESEVNEGVDFLQELSSEVEGFVAATDSETQPETEPEELPPLEGQIADIEFLLKEVEKKPLAPSFEITQVYDEFQKNIIWEKEDIKKRLTLAKKAFDAELYEAALDFVGDIKDDKKLWPLSLELQGGSLIKLGRYNEAVKSIGSAIFLEEIKEAQKIELRYLFATAYQGLGDFDNALREMEHIMQVDPHYKDVREIYGLLGGKEIYVEVKKEKPQPPEEPEVVEKPLHVEKETVPPVVKPEGEKMLEPEQGPPVQLEPKEEVLQKVDEGYPTIEEPPPEKKPPDKSSGEIPVIEEEKGEKISFL